MDSTSIGERIFAVRRILAVVVVTLAGSGLVPSSVGALERKATVCHPSAVHYRTKQSPTGVSGVPWIASMNSAFRGYLFYWGGTRWARTRPKTVQIFTTKAHVSVNPKVLWVALRPSGAVLTIRGTRLDAAGSFSAQYPAAIGGGQFPSYVSIPAAGCWEVSVRSGSLQGRVMFRATDLP